MRAEGGLPLVSLANAYQIEHILEVKEREVLAAVHAVEQIARERERVPVLLRDLVETTIVDAET